MRPSDKDHGHDEIYRYLDVHGIENKDSFSPAYKGESREKLRQKKKPVSRVLDLHGMTVAQSITLITDTVDSAAREGVRQLCIIHGRGLHARHAEEAPVLKPAVRELLEGKLRDRIQGWRPAKPNEGGMGATIVFLP